MSGRPPRSIFSICAPCSEYRNLPTQIGIAGFADVWKRHCFAWEYKGKRSNLVQASAQLKRYADAFDNPPLLIVSDMQEIRVHTNFTNAIAQQHVILLAERRSVEARALLRNCFLHPERLLPTQTRESVTAEAAAKFASIAVRLRQRYDDVASLISSTSWCSAYSPKPKTSSWCRIGSLPTASTSR